MNIGAKSVISLLRPKQKTTTTRIVRSKRWIPSAQLKLGMYVSELDIPWEQTPFMFQGFNIDSQELLEKVQSVSETVCIESEKVATIPSQGGNRLCGAPRKAI
ncbi:MAG: DUF3391 domain-containing protein [Gammaproteobacteria bacterium]|nr:DUF3391 domain-containing protein [Gammaproteobacteria bacterium]